MLIHPKAVSKALGAPSVRKPIRILIAFLLMGLSGDATADEMLTRIADVRQLSREQAAQAQTIRVRGVVTWRNARDNLTIQDDSAGIWVDFVEARKRKLFQSGKNAFDHLREGTEVEITGVSDPGGYAPQIIPATLRVIGRKPMPKALLMEPSRFFNGSADCQRVEVRGVVQGYYPVGDGITLLLDANPGRFTAQLSSAASVPDPAKLLDSEISLKGVAATHFNTRGESTGVRVLSSVAEDLVVEKPPPPSDEVPWVALDRLLPFRTEPLGPHRVKVEGTVIYSLGGRFFYLQEGDSAVRVETTSSIELRPGDRVEAAGFVEISRLIGTLCDASVRKTGTGVPPEPVSISPGEILELNKVAVETAQVALPHDYDGHLIRCRARLLAVRSEPRGNGLRTLTLEQTGKEDQGDLIFRALLYNGKAGPVDLLLPGSELEITGLVQLDYATKDVLPRISRTVPENLNLILRGPSDVVVLSEPSWWTAGHLTAVLAAMLLALGGALVWSLQLKRQVRRKTLQLAREMHARRDAAIEFQATLRERTRLAANLHDTLLQTMSGLGFQIEACESEVVGASAGDGPPSHLKVAKRMVNHAVDELRNSVWALRSLPLNGMELPEALDALADRLGAGQSARIEVHSEGDLSRVPDFVAGNLLLIVQESLHNAIRHGKPKVVGVDIRTLDDPERISLTVRDDGSGFVPGEQVGVVQGHFGLQGMRERLERLEGTLAITSAPGQGTTIHVEAPLRAYDGEMAERPIDSPENQR
ncbi:MAG: sensor histidine kinase [Luteolibacter sp.]|uniref:sensor histidine kinase n=1 Tax=Luteolibacter sp. TaxID=1962973 RepID=UPI0032676E63